MICNPPRLGWDTASEMEVVAGDSRKPNYLTAALEGIAPLIT